MRTDLKLRTFLCGVSNIISKKKQHTIYVQEGMKMLHKFNEGKKYINDEIVARTAHHIPLAERWRNNRYALVAFVNAPFILKLFDPYSDLINLFFWAYIVYNSIILITIRSEYEGNHMEHSSMGIVYYKKARRESELIDYFDHSLQSQWHEKYIKNNTNYFDFTNFSNFKLYKNLTDDKISKLVNNIKNIFLLAVLYQIIKIIVLFYINDSLVKLVVHEILYYFYVFFETHYYLIDLLIENIFNILQPVTSGPPPGVVELEMNR